MVRNVLSIAGSDPSGGAGIQADLKSFAAAGCYGMAVVTALTAQNTRGVRAIHLPPADFVGAQIDAIFEDIRVDAVKIGMLATGEIVATVAERLARYGARNIVVDPVLVATSGDSLGAPDVVDAMRVHLFPLATLLTPNLPEAARLSGLPEPADPSGFAALADRLRADGAAAGLIKGGHLAAGEAVDMLFTAEGARRFAAPRIETRNTHGTGCTLSSAIAARLARGEPLGDAVAGAKAYLTGALRESGALDVGTGAGHGPVNHFWSGAR